MFYENIMNVLIVKLRKFRKTKVALIFRCFKGICSMANLLVNFLTPGLDSQIRVLRAASAVPIISDIIIIMGISNQGQAC